MLLLTIDRLNPIIYDRIMKWFTIGQAAKELGVSIRTMERWKQNGKLKPARNTKGQHGRYHKDQLVKIQLEQLLA